MEEKIRIVRKFNQENRYRDGGVLNNAIDDTLNELERLQKENDRYKRIKPIMLDGDYELNVEEFLEISDKLYNLQHDNTCLHCGNDTPLYCEKCYQDLITKNGELQLENNDLRTIRETVRYLEEEGEKDDLYYVVGRGTYLADVLNSAFNDYIPKQVIRDKIKEVNKEYKKYTEKWEKSGMNKEHPFYRYIVRLEAQIDILEELLNEVN